MAEHKKEIHTIYDIKYHFVWVTKYRCRILEKKIGIRLRELIRQGCENIGLTIIKGNVGKDHVHVLLSCPTHIAPSEIVQYLKRGSSKFIQDEFPELKKRYWGQHLWASGYFCGTVGSVTEKMIKEYIEKQDKKDIGEIFRVEE